MKIYGLGCIAQTVPLPSSGRRALCCRKTSFLDRLQLWRSSILLGETHVVGREKEPQRKTNESATYPAIMESAKLGSCPDDKGITAYYSNSCPFTDYYTNQLLREYSKSKNVPLTVNHIKSREEGREMPIPWVINSVFYKGELVTLEMKAERHLDKVIT